MSPKAKTTTTEQPAEDMGAGEAPSSGQSSRKKKLSLETVSYDCAKCGIGMRRWKCLDAWEVGDDRIRCSLECLGCGATLEYEDDKDEITRRAS